MTAKPPPTGAPAGRRRRLVLRSAIALLILAALLGAGHAALWRWMGAEMEKGFAAWVQSRRAAGWRVTHAAPMRGGWPFAATLTVRGLRLSGGAATLPGGMDWQAETVVLRVVLPRIDRLVVELPGPQRMRLGEAELAFAADRLEAVLPLEPGVPPRQAEILAERLRLRTALGAAALREARIALETRSTAIEGEPALDIDAVARGIELPPGVTPPAGFGRAIESATLEAALTGPIPAGRDPVRRAETWRDAGGTLELRSLALRWGPVDATATATITLDEAMQPMGAGTVRAAGVGEAVDALAAAGAIGRRAALSARAVLTLMARVPPEGGPPEVEVPLTLEDRTLTVARIPVARLPRLDWPAPSLPDLAADPSLPGR
jgi:hypothetical protein